MQLTVVARACSEVAGHRADIEAQLEASAARTEFEATRAQEYKDRFKKSEAARKKLEDEKKKLQSELQAASDEVRVQKGMVSDVLQLSLAFKDYILEKLQTTRFEAVRDYIDCLSHKFLTGVEYDVARNQGFRAAIGQL